MKTQSFRITEEQLPEKLNAKPSSVNRYHQSAHYMGIYSWDPETYTYLALIVDTQFPDEDPRVITIGRFTDEARAHVWMDKALKAFDADLPEPPDDVQLAH